MLAPKIIRSKHLFSVFIYKQKIAYRGSERILFSKPKFLVEILTEYLELYLLKSTDFCVFVQKSVVREQK